MMQRIDLREFAPQDLSLVKTLVDRTIDVTYLPVFPEEAIRGYKAHHSREQILADASNGYTVVLEDGEAIIGTGTLLDRNIRRVFIDPAYQRKGLGRQVMHELEDRALANRASEVDLQTTVVSKEFYHSLGYTPVQEDHILVGNGQELAIYTMSKELLRRND